MGQLAKNSRSGWPKARHARASRPFSAAQCRSVATQTSSWVANLLGACVALAKLRSFWGVRASRHALGPATVPSIAFRVWFYACRCRTMDAPSSRCDAPADREPSPHTPTLLSTQPVRARYHPGLQAVSRVPVSAADGHRVRVRLARSRTHAGFPFRPAASTHETNRFGFRHASWTTGHVAQ
jgi:hypothetical protein